MNQISNSSFPTGFDHMIQKLKGRATVLYYMLLTKSSDIKLQVEDVV